MRNRSPGNPAKDYAADRRRKKGVDPVQNRDYRVEPTGTAPPEERAALIGVGMDGRADDAELPVFDELAELARTAGARVVLRFYQRKANPESSSYLGSGKMQELAKEVKDTGATLVIADDDLSPAQVRHLEEATCVRVIDRSELIIDIFAKQAAPSRRNFRSNWLNFSISPRVSSGCGPTCRASPARAVSEAAVPAKSRSKSTADSSRRRSKT